MFFPVTTRAALDPGCRPAALAAFCILAVSRASLSWITRSGTRGGEELPHSILTRGTDDDDNRATNSQSLTLTRSTMRLTRSAIRPYVCPSCRSGAVAGRRRFASQPEQVPDIYDVVCVGGGPAGLGLLAALSMLSASVSTESTLI